MESCMSWFPAHISHDNEKSLDIFMSRTQRIHLQISVTVDYLDVCRFLYFNSTISKYSQCTTSSTCQSASNGSIVAFMGAPSVYKRSSGQEHLKTYFSVPMTMFVYVTLVISTSRQPFRQSQFLRLSICIYRLI